ncbi:coniferyl aldehyde dehydrogenase [Fastidiosibacter lacustris]|uniref:coniferyl aldehyde dehydrogenase n=1 Tax=Fastidiosibacter lacustris TaxID=2056695 RepID=UPI000E3571CC|nr:coniferyl aldehyde dehydrogenase [Fastidiosibacter lacustris]
MLGVYQSENLQTLLKLQQQAFLLQPYPELAFRKQRLKRLYARILSHQQQLMEAVSKDFGFRSLEETWLSEIFQTTSTIKYVLANLKKWMKKHKRRTSIIFKPAKNYIYYQPLGVVGIIVPWNYPILLAFSPLIYAIAAGNKVCIKLSEYTPHTNEVIKLICQSCFNSDEVAVITGEADMAQAFSRLAFDHLFFTGSTQTGKKVMQSASANLTPVTLELGGKSPLIIDKDFPLEKAVKMICFAKGLNAGQTCIAPDYVFVHEKMLDQFIVKMQKAFNEVYPELDKNQQYSSIINQKHYERLQGYLIEAEEAGVKILFLSDYHGRRANDVRKLPIVLVVNPSFISNLMQEEIFGPILPIVTYTAIEEVVDTISHRDKPLASYLFSYDKALQEYIITHVASGGMCINDVLSHIAQHDLPFGGVGGSGMGRYHGIEGFKTFSNEKAICERGRINLSMLLYPPYGRVFRWFQSLFSR